MTSQGVTTTRLRNPNAATSSAPADVFVDRHGTAHALDATHRDRIKPGWRKSLSGPNIDALNAADGVTDWDSLQSRIDLGLHMLGLHGGDVQGRDILVVGAGGWEELICLLGRGARNVVGVDNSLSPELTGQLSISDAGKLLASECLIGTVHAVTNDPDRWQPIPGAKARLAQIDVADGSLSNASFDVVASWRTLEHLTEPAAAMREMCRVLRPGGFAYHEYNPFFCIEGGHALVTLDIPWGHVRLSGDDVDRFLRTARPQEYARAIDYYHNCLNRMTLADCRSYGREAGFEALTFLPRARTEDVLELSPQAFDEARRNYRNVTIEDLVCRMVRRVLRKPVDA